METKHIILIILLVVITIIFIGVVIGVIIYFDDKDKKAKEANAIQPSPPLPPIPPPNNNINPNISTLPANGTYYSSLAAGGATPSIPSTVTTKSDFNTYVDGKGVFVTQAETSCDSALVDIGQSSCNFWPCTTALNKNAVGWQINNNSGYTILPGIVGGPSCQNSVNTSNPPSNVYYSKTEIPPGGVLNWDNIPEFTIIQNSNNINFFYTFFVNCTFKFLYYNSSGPGYTMGPTTPNPNIVYGYTVVDESIDVNSQYIKITVTGNPPTFSASIANLS